MARPYIGPRLYQRTRNGSAEHWRIRDGEIEVSTFHKDLDKAQKVLEAYCAEKGIPNQNTPKTGQRKYPETTIYFISTIDVPDYPIKIGISDMGAERRMNILQNASPYKLVVLASFKGDRNTERELHRRFAATRMEREWFARSLELLEYIAAIPTPEGVSGEFHGKERLEWSERLDSNQRPLSPQKTASS